MRIFLALLVVSIGCRNEPAPAPSASLPGLDITPATAWRYLAWWEWATGKDVRPVALTSFCDWIFERPDGSIHSLSILDGSVERISDSRRTLDDALKSDWARDRYLWDTFTQRARRAGKKLEPGECYSFIVPPVIGGSFEEENVRPFSIAGYQLVMSQLALLVRRVPVGTETSRLQIDVKEGIVELLLDGVPIQ